MKIINQYTFGDMSCYYFLDPSDENVQLLLLPSSKKYQELKKEKPYLDSLIQIKLVGDAYPGGYAGGNTLRQGATVQRFRFQDQSENITEQMMEIITTLKDDRDYRVVHHLSWNRGEKVLHTYCEFINHGKETAGLELLSSFSLSMISPYLTSENFGDLYIHRLRSVWSMEGRLESIRAEDLQLEPSWAGHAVRSERFGQVGSIPVNRFFPFLLVEDRRNHIYWGAQLAHNASWQMEIYRRGDDINISGGLADREFGHWMKNIEPGECFSSPSAILTVAESDSLDLVSQRLSSAADADLEMGPVCEQSLPLIFNEYCTTWGNPSHENICRIVDAVKNKGFEYFVIDCGWYKEEGVPWDVSMGDYEVSESLFPEGLEKTVQYIKEHGMKPGLWFEIDNVGEKSRAYQNTEHLLKRDGRPLTTTMRRFWDMRDPWVLNYLQDKVIGTLRKYGFEYVKMDYNDTIGLGCDGAESLGEALRQNMECSLNFIRKIKKEIPGIIIENCASGGHKLEPLLMQECSMASFSDAHECEEIPIIAANLHRVIAPRQSQIWAVIRKTDSLKRIAYSIINTYLGRMCLSGDVLDLSEQQWKVIDQGIVFYRQITTLIKNGTSRWYGTKINSYRYPQGWQCILRTGNEGKAVAVFHVFENCTDDKLEIDLPEEMISCKIVDQYSDATVKAEVKNKKLIFDTEGERQKAAAILLDWEI